MELTTWTINGSLPLKQPFTSKYVLAPSHCGHGKEKYQPTRCPAPIAGFGDSASTSWMLC